MIDVNEELKKLEKFDKELLRSYFGEHYLRKNLLNLCNDFPFNRVLDYCEDDYDKLLMFTEFIQELGRLIDKHYVNYSYIDKQSIDIVWAYQGQQVFKKALGMIRGAMLTDIVAINIFRPFLDNFPEESVDGWYGGPHRMPMVCRVMDLQADLRRSDDPLDKYTLGSLSGNIMVYISKLIESGKCDEGLKNLYFPYSKAYEEAQDWILCRLYYYFKNNPDVLLTLGEKGQTNMKWYMDQVDNIDPCDLGTLQLALDILKSRYISDAIDFDAWSSVKNLNNPLDLISPLVYEDKILNIIERSGRFDHVPPVLYKILVRLKLYLESGEVYEG